MPAPGVAQLSCHAPLLSEVLPRSPVAAAGPLPALRAATRTRHDRVDRLMDLRRLGEPARYARVLQALDAFLAAWEPHVAAALPPAGRAWLGRRSRRAFLQQDLRLLGIPPLERAAPLPVLAGPAAAWGSIYVMEGSALGGQAIGRRLARSGLHPDCGAAYFHGWGADTAAMWLETRALLQQEVAPADLPRACAAACGTFDALSHLLESVLDAPPGRPQALSPLRLRRGEAKHDVHSLGEVVQ